MSQAERSASTKKKQELLAKLICGALEHAALAFFERLMRLEGVSCFIRKTALDALFYFDEMKPMALSKGCAESAWWSGLVYHSMAARMAVRKTKEEL